MYIHVFGLVCSVCGFLCQCKALMLASGGGFMCACMWVFCVLVKGVGVVFVWAHP